ncbi:MAG: NADH-quinone oxidoreductase subunit C [Candidatus Omnitrophica bacterium]|nr:NADH-quinone oxidoreductase subunit C [Candidatus Omnitrophota bacterium]
MSNTASQDILTEVRERLSAKVTQWDQISGRRVYIRIEKGDLLEVARYLFFEKGARFCTASGVDMRDAMEIVYHFSFDGIGCVLSMKVQIAKPALEVESLAQLFRAAEWVEREIHELLGITFLHHPNLKHLLLDDDWPEGDYPLRRYPNE